VVARRPAASFFQRPMPDGDRRATTPRHLGPNVGEASVLVLRTAYHSLDPAPYHVTPGAARPQFWTGPPLPAV